MELQTPLNLEVETDALPNEERVSTRSKVLAGLSGVFSIAALTAVSVMALSSSPQGSVFVDDGISPTDRAASERISLFEQRGVTRCFSDAECGDFKSDSTEYISCIGLDDSTMESVGFCGSIGKKCKTTDECTEGKICMAYEGMAYGYCTRHGRHHRDAPPASEDTFQPVAYAMEVDDVAPVTPTISLMTQPKNGGASAPLGNADRAKNLVWTSTAGEFLASDHPLLHDLLHPTGTPRLQVPLANRSETRTRGMKHRRAKELTGHGNEFHTLAFGRCDNHKCDNPNEREKQTYMTAKNGGSTKVDLTVTYHLVPSSDGEYSIDMNTLGGQAGAVSRQYDAAGFNVKNNYIKYDESDSGRMAHVWVGSYWDCTAANKLLLYDNGGASWQGFSLIRAEIVYHDRSREAIMMYKGDKVTVSIDTQGIKTEVCIVQCSDKDCDNYRNDKRVFCRESTSHSFAYTLKDAKWSYYAIEVKESTMPPTKYKTWSAEIGWERIASCVEPETYIAHISPTYYKSLPFQVYIVPFPPSIAYNGYAANQLLGFGNFPWDDKALIGVLFMGWWAINPEPEDTLIHEMGHCMGLFHTFHGYDEQPDGKCGKCSENLGQSAALRDTVGDFCSDTNPMPRQFECTPPSGNHECSNQPWDSSENRAPTNNFMSYGDQCNTEITAQQISRMVCYIKNSEKVFLRP